MCDKCLEIHSNFLPNHHIYISNINKESDETFSEFCREEKHNQFLEYYCKTHNKLCCALCITKIKDKEKGQHKDCDICIIEDIKDQKHSELEDNIVKLEQLLNKLNKIINEPKELFKKIEINKEQLKKIIKITFDVMRSTLKSREEKLLSEVDEKCSLQHQGDLIKESENEKLLDKIKKSLEKGKILDKNWNDSNKLNSLINECITIENSLKELNEINEEIKSKNENEYIGYKFIPEDFEICDTLKIISKFGEIQQIKNGKEESKNEKILNTGEEFPIFIEELKNQLKIETKIGDKNDLDIEIRGSKNDPKGASLDLFIIEQKLFKEYFSLCEGQIKSALFAFTFNFELKDENNFNSIKNMFEEFKKGIIEQEFSMDYPDKCDIFLKNNGKKVSLVFISRKGKMLQLLLELCVNLSEYIKFDFNIKTEININDLFNQFSDEDISNLFNALVKIKLSGENLRYLQKSIITILKKLKLKDEEYKTDLITVINVIMFFIGINLKVEYDIGLFRNYENFIKNIKENINFGKNILENMFKPFIEAFEFKDFVTAINFDSLSFSF